MSIERHYLLTGVVSDVGLFAAIGMADSEVVSSDAVCSADVVVAAVSSGASASDDIETSPSSCVSTGGVVFSSVASPLSFVSMGLVEFVGEIESVG